MKELFNPLKKLASTGSKKSPAISKPTDVKAFLGKVAAMPKNSGDARLVFALDATASRQSTWDIASQLQTEMFSCAQSLGGLSVQLCYFRGFADFYKSAWQTSGPHLLSKMSGIRCQAGATKIELVLRHVIAENARGRVKCVVYIGDAMEESRDCLADLAGKLGVLNIPIFVFQERDDPIAKQCFKELARLSGGAYAQFDVASASLLKELLQAVAVYAAGGLKALQSFSAKSTPAIKMLEQQIKS
jgi:hypothetical protein